MRLVIAVTLTALAAPVFAQNEAVHPYTKANISPVGFVMKDGATANCWTNADAAPDLVAEALGIAGLTFTEGADAKTQIFLWVDVDRDSDGCQGSLMVDLIALSSWEGQPITMTLRDSGAAIAGHANVDSIVPLLIDHFILKELATFPAE